MGEIAMKYYPRPTGKLEGDNKPMPDRGTKTGQTDNYGADLGPEATNGMGPITGPAKSDKADPA
jgi:hypothetical protein